MFLCLLQRDGTPVSDTDRRRYASRIRALAKASEVESDHIEIIEAGEFVAFVAPEVVPLRPLWGHQRGLVGIGNVRLDHRQEVRRWSGMADTHASEIDLVLHAVDARGTQCLRDVLGDFAIVVWEARTRTLTAARDAFGVKTLFAGGSDQLLVLSSHLELVHERDVMDEEYLADFLLGGDPGPERTIWADSRAIAQGSLHTWRDDTHARERFWDPFDFAPTTDADKQTQVEQFHALFREAVRTKLEPNGQTWAELSGGLDSSSIVSMAQTMLRAGGISEGIAGTISIVDMLGSGNEQRFSDLVVQQFGLPNTTIDNPWPWQDDGRPAPRTDEPRTHYPFFARDRFECATVRAAGGRVLLSGMGSDHYLYGSRLFIADLFAKGHAAQAIAELSRWSVLEKCSFWASFMYDGVAPLLPVAAQMPLQKPWLKVPDWIAPRFALRTKISQRLQPALIARAPRGHKFAWHAAGAMQELVRWLPRGPFEEGLELRYPFLYRPLVEFGLRLSPAVRSQPLKPKWILREAMRGVLPESIRARVGKGAIDARLIWGIRRERRRIEQILEHATLPQMGVIQANVLQSAVDRATQGELSSVITLLSVLSLETWLYVRSNRWTASKDADIDNPKFVHRSTVQPA